MSLILNILWLIFGGFFMAVGWFVAGVILAFTIVGLPWSLACFRMAKLAFFPFGSRVVNTEDYAGYGDIGTGPLGSVGNIIWFIFAGVWIAIGHLFCAFACAITIIGIPFALQHLKLAGLALAPIGKTVVDVDQRWPSDRRAYR
jgi:uncharacterized membrane protein YccF (DUF307 family)